ncbi:spectrin beta chain, non-erythrocytic 1 [Trichonephila clavipes]|nr:spectrin beta chain, non-erythrocytic 1 [Trichonephila clavipes]
MEKYVVKSKVLNLIDRGEELIEMNCTENIIRHLIKEMREKYEALEDPITERKKKLETCLKFHQFKSDVDRELLWISEQMTTLSTNPTCKNLFEAQKFQKKIENLEVSIENRKTAVENLQEKVLILVTEEECPVDVTQPCKKMQKEWTLLLNEFYNQKERACNALKAQTFFGEATEIDAWMIEKMEILSNTDYGKDEDAVIKLLTKHKAMELEIDSYKGLVAELASQADALIESNHPDCKVIKNRMEVINQEMKNIQKLCTVKRQKLLESKSRHEFEKETEELKIWINEQMTEATSEDFGDDYEHVLAKKLTVWCALWAGGIIGPYFFKNDEGHNVTVNGDRYRAMITNFFIPELNNHDVQELWFQQDGATCHTARITIDLLKDTFGDRLISRFGPVNWPPRSCDLTPLDYFLWGYVKSLVYADKPQTLDHLEDNIHRVIADIRPQMLEKVIENWTSRLDYIRASRGSHVPEIIFKM